MAEEETVWTGSPAQILNFSCYFLCVLIAIALIALTIMVPKVPPELTLAGIAAVLIIALWRSYGTRTTIYRLTNQRLIVEKGILNRREDSLELYRVKDSQLYKPLFLRMFHLGNIRIITSDATTPEVLLTAIRDVNLVQDKLRSCVEERRKVTRTRDVELAG